MATDWYPSEENVIMEDSCYIVPMRPDGAINEMSAVKFGTSTSGRISVAAAAAVADGWGIALRAATAANTPARIPVLLYGICKQTQSGTGSTITQGNFVMNSAASGVVKMGNGVSTNGVLFAGSSYVLGMAMQTTTANGDEILVCVGKCL